ncbi:MAG TPA: FAD:protein FMN transferase [Chloroflexota bacterium]
MGMPIGIDVRDPDIFPAVLDRGFDWLRRVDATFSTYKPDSEISRLNRGEMTLAQAQADVRWVLERCEQLRFQTGGYFDIRAAFIEGGAGERIEATSSVAVDPSGLVKGWSVDRAARILEEGGARNYSINAGGDVRVKGGALPDPAWRVGIQHPLLRDKIAAVVVADDLAIATSGTYERGEHIIDPITGSPPVGILSVTIVGPDLATADAYATAAFAMGETGPAWTAGLGDYEAMTILADERVLFTSGFPKQ